VRVAEPVPPDFTVTLAELNVTVSPDGNVEEPKLTVLAKEFRLATVTVEVLLMPELTVNAGALEDNEKSGRRSGAP
jgi:hypothetical protein